MGATSPAPYRWRIGDVFTNGTSRWAVDSIDGTKAVLRSCGSSWATTIPLSLDEWIDGGRWRREVVRVTVDCVHCGTYEPTDDERRALAGRSLLAGFTCPRCHDEIDVLVDGKPATPGQGEVPR